jgi:1,4-dihydroxy-2-naphthoate octaprenyltransferase
MLIGTLWAYVSGNAFSLGTAALFALATFFVDLGTAGFNSYFDFKRGVDTEATDVEKYKVLVQRRLNPRVALWISLGVFGVAGVLGLTLGARVGWEVVGVGAACMGIAFFYSGGPFPLSATPLGELFAGGVMGSVLIALASYVQTGALDRGAVLLGLPSTLLIACILTVNNTCDIEGDRRAGRRTMSIVLGVERCRYFIDALLFGTWALAFALIPLGVLNAWGAVPLAVTLGLAVKLSRGMHARGYSHATKGPSMGGVSGIFVLYTLAMITALVLKRVLGG